MKKKFFIQMLVIGGLLAIVLLVVLLLVFKSEPAIEENVVPVKTVKPVLGEIERVYSVSGYIESEAMVQVHSKVSGNIRKFYVGISDRVDEGALLLKIDDAPYLTQLNGYKQAFLAAKSTYSRVSNLYKGGAAALQDYEKARAEFEAYKAKYDYANMEFNWTKVRSPIKGTVLQRYVSTGQVVSPEVALLIIADLDNLIIKAKIPEDNYSTFVKGRDDIVVRVRYSALADEVFTAKIDSISEYIEPQSKSFEVVCKLTSGSDILRPGMFVSVSFVIDSKKNVYKLPLRALVGNDRLWYVDKSVNRAKKLIFKPIFFDDDFFAVSDGYKDFDFIVEGNAFIYDGQPVKSLDDLNKVVENEKKVIDDKIDEKNKDKKGVDKGDLKTKVKNKKSKAKKIRAKSNKNKAVKKKSGEKDLEKKESR